MYQVPTAAIGIPRTKTTADLIKFPKATIETKVVVLVPLVLFKKNAHTKVASK